MSVITVRPLAPSVPASVTRAQALIALYETGLLELAEEMVNTHPYYPVKLWWDNALNFERSNPYLNGLALELGLTDQHVDSLFITASTRL